jgi:DNA repair protein RecO (recombination protein O)
LYGDALLSGFYLNELVMRLLARHDPHPELFVRYQHTLEQLALNNDLDWTLRLFERDLLQELGYGLLLTQEGESGAEVEPDVRYCYHYDSGPRRMVSTGSACLDVQGAALLALAAGECNDTQLRRECKWLMREVLKQYLGPRPLASRELFRRKRPTKQEE